MAVGVFTQLCPSRLQRLQADKGGSADLKKVLLISKSYNSVIKRVG